MKKGDNMKDVYEFFAKLEKEAYDMWDNNQRIAYIDFIEGFSGSKIFCNMREVIPLLIVYLHDFSNQVLKKHATLQQVERFLYFYIPDKKCWYNISCYKYNDRVDWDIYKEDSCYSMSEIFSMLLKVKNNEI